jgi:hypothetical protein
VWNDGPDASVTVVYVATEDFRAVDRFESPLRKQAERCEEGQSKHRPGLQLWQRCGSPSAQMWRWRGPSRRRVRLKHEGRGFPVLARVATESPCNIVHEWALRSSRTNGSFGRATPMPGMPSGVARSCSSICSFVSLELSRCSLLSTARRRLHVDDLRLLVDHGIHLTGGRPMTRRLGHSVVVDTPRVPIT